jgi:hypothetical protein
MQIPPWDAQMMIVLINLHPADLQNVPQDAVYEQRTPINTPAQQQNKMPSSCVRRENK